MVAHQYKNEWQRLVIYKFRESLLMKPGNLLISSLVLIFISMGSVVTASTSHKGATYPIKSFPPLCSEYIDPKDSSKFSHCPGVVEPSSDKWQGYFEIMGKPGTARSIGQADMFVPLAQDANDMLFFNLRGQIDDLDSSEYNIGLGHRHMFDKFILGGYGYYDHRKTEYDSYVEQVTLGVEALSENFDLRGNGYIAETGTEKLISTEFLAKADNPVALIRGKKSLSGMDFEVGYKLPVSRFLKIKDMDLFADTRIYMGGYHFIGDDIFESVTGPRVRLETRIHDLPILGNGSRLMMGVESQYDDPRGSQTFGLVSLRIPFGVASKKIRTPLKGLDRRMMEPVVRDVDIVIGEANQEVPVQHPNGKDYTNIATLDADSINPDTGEKMTAWEANEAMRIAVESGKTPLGAVTDSGDNTWSVDGMAVSGGWTWANGGKTLKIAYKDSLFGPGTVNFTPGRKAPTITGNQNVSGDTTFVDLEDGAHINGWEIDASEREYGLKIKEPGTYYVTNVKVSNAALSGIQADGNKNDETEETQVHIRDSEFIDNNWFKNDAAHGQISAYRGGTIYADGLMIDGGSVTKMGVVSSRDDSYLKITNSTVSGGAIGIFTREAESTLIADQILIEKTSRAGAETAPDGNMTITRSRIVDNLANGIATYSRASTYMEDMIIENNNTSKGGKYAVVTYGNGETTIVNSIITGNGGGAVIGFQISTTNIFNSEISNNNGFGLRANKTAKLYFWGDTNLIFGNTFEGESRNYMEATDDSTIFINGEPCGLGQDACRDN